MDSFSKKNRSRIMRAVRCKNTKLELSFRKELSKRGYRYRINHAKMIGKPDIVMQKHRLVVFIDSCFWHGCRYHCRKPSSNRKYWNDKISRNINRDKEVNRWYKTNKWKMLRFWEHQIKKDISRCADNVKLRIFN